MARSRTTRQLKPYDESFFFANLPKDIMLSEAFNTLPDYAVRCLIALLVENRTSRDPGQRNKSGPGNNGDLSLSAKTARQYGLQASWKVSAGLTILRAVGLIEVTRQGGLHQSTARCSLYGLTWLPIAPSEKHDRPTCVPRTASHAWRTFKKPADWKLRERDIRRKAQTGKKERPMPPCTRELLSDKRSCANPINPACSSARILHTSGLDASHEFGREGCENITSSQQPVEAIPATTAIQQGSGSLE